MLVLAQLALQGLRGCQHPPALLSEPCCDLWKVAGMAASCWRGREAATDSATGSAEHLVDCVLFPLLTALA